MRLNTSSRRKEELPEWMRQMDHFRTSRPMQEAVTSNTAEQPSQPPVEKPLRSYASPPMPVQVKAAENGQTLGLFFGWRYHFSNFHPALFDLDGHTWTCNEHFYVHEKLHHFGRHDLARSLTNTPSTPRDMKLLGGDVEFAASEEARAEWTQRKVEVMKRGVRAKFEQNPELAKALLATGNWELVEASASDQFWGSGLSLEQAGRHAKVADWRLAGGRNMLGNVLMWVRGGLKEAEKAGGGGGGGVVVPMPKQLVGARPIPGLPLERRSSSSSSSNSSFAPNHRDRDLTGFPLTSLTEAPEKSIEHVVPSRGQTPMGVSGRNCYATVMEAAQVWDIDEEGDGGGGGLSAPEPKTIYVERKVKRGERKANFDQPPLPLPGCGFNSAELEDNEVRPALAEFHPTSSRQDNRPESMCTAPSCQKKLVRPDSVAKPINSTHDVGEEQDALSQKWNRRYGMVSHVEPKREVTGMGGPQSWDELTPTANAKMRFAKGPENSPPTRRYPQSKRLVSTNVPCEEGFGAGSDMDAEGVDGGMEAMIASFSSNIRVAKKGTASKSKGPPQYGFYSPDDDDVTADRSGFRQTSRTYFTEGGSKDQRGE